MSQEDWKSLRKAKMAYIEGRIIELILNDIRIYVFIGKDRDYLVNENGCTCKYFFYNLGKKYCYHILALKLSLDRENYKKYKISADEFKEILYEIYSMGKSLKLRKIISRGYH
jgi:predicted nucleic acid-binding Zn finger protein